MNSTVTEVLKLPPIIESTNVYESSSVYRSDSSRSSRSHRKEISPVRRGKGAVWIRYDHSNRDTMKKLRRKALFTSLAFLKHHPFRDEIEYPIHEYIWDQILIVPAVDGEYMTVSSGSN